VNIAVEQERRLAGGHRVEVVAMGHAAREVLHRPAAADHPRHVRVLGDVRRYCIAVRRPAGEPAQIDGVQIATGLRDVDVRVLKARDHERTDAVEDARPWSDPVGRIRAQRDDPATVDGDRVDRRAVTDPDPRPDDGEVCARTQQPRLVAVAQITAGSECESGISPAASRLACSQAKSR
jgi:hypothetical protein